MQGTLDLLVLKALALGPLHGLGVSRRIEQITKGTFQVKPGSLFPSLHPMEQAGWLASSWGAAVAIIFVIAVIVYICVEKSRRPLRIFGERSTIKGLLPFSIADREIFKQLQREAELTECYQAVTDRNFRFGVLSGESGGGKQPPKSCSR